MNFSPLLYIAVLTASLAAPARAGEYEILARIFSAGEIGTESRAVIGRFLGVGEGAKLAELELVLRSGSMERIRALELSAETVERIDMLGHRARAFGVGFSGEVFAHHDVAVQLISELHRFGQLERGELASLESLAKDPRFALKGGEDLLLELVTHGDAESLSMIPREGSETEFVTLAPGSRAPRLFDRTNIDVHVMSARASEELAHYAEIWERSRLRHPDIQKRIRYGLKVVTEISPEAIDEFIALMAGEAERLRPAWDEARENQLYVLIESEAPVTQFVGLLKHRLNELITAIGFIARADSLGLTDVTSQKRLVHSLLFEGGITHVVDGLKRMTSNKLRFKATSQSLGGDAEKFIRDYEAGLDGLEDAIGLQERVVRGLQSLGANVPAPIRQKAEEMLGSMRADLDGLTGKSR